MQGGPYGTPAGFFAITRFWVKISGWNFRTINISLKYVIKTQFFSIYIYISKIFKKTPIPRGGGSIWTPPTTFGKNGTKMVKKCLCIYISKKYRQFVARCKRNYIKISFFKNLRAFWKFSDFFSKKNFFSKNFFFAFFQKNPKIFKMLSDF